MTGRFQGWTKEDVLRLQNKKGDILKPRETSRGTRNKSNHKDYVGAISNALNILGIKHVREYKFLHDRRFRFDLAIPGKMIALEWEGMIWRNGRHTRGKGYANDCKKYNLATMHGWKLLRYTTEDAKKKGWEFDIAEEIRNFIEKGK